MTHSYSHTHTVIVKFCFTEVLTKFLVWRAGERPHTFGVTAYFNFQTLSHCHSQSQSVFADSINHQSKDGHRSQFIIIYDKGDRDFNLMMLITSMGEEEHVMKTQTVQYHCVTA